MGINPSPVLGIHGAGNSCRFLIINIVIPLKSINRNKIVTTEVTLYAVGAESNFNPLCIAIYVVF